MPLPLIPIAMMGASFLSSLFNRRSQNKPQVTTSTNSNTNTATTAPTLSPEYKGLQDMILPMVSKRLSNPQGLPPGYLENGIQNINETYNDAKMGLDNDLTARGLGTSPIAGQAMTSFNRGRATDIAKFRNASAEKGRAMENDDLATALSVLNFGRGSTSTSTGSGTGTVTAPPPGGGGSPTMGAFGDLSKTIGWLIGSGAFGKGGGGGGGLGGLSQLGNMNFRF